MSRAKRSGLDWSKSEVTRLRTYAANGVSSRIAAEKLGRAPGATRFKAMIEGISFRRLRAAA